MKFSSVVAVVVSAVVTGATVTEVEEIGSPVR